jgi:hypothetical protein
LLLLAASLALLWPALRPGWTLIPAQLPYLLDPLWQPLAPPGAQADANPLLGDLFYQYYPWATAARQSLAQGELPLWNPAVAGGHPFAANGMIGLFNPFNLLTLPVPLSAAWTGSALLRLWVAGLFAYLYARTLGLSRPAAALAMLTYAFCGPMIVWLNYPLSHVFAWLPALLWSGEKLLTTRRPGWILATAVFLAVTIFSSQPEVAFQMGVVWGVYLAVRSIGLAGGVGLALRRDGLAVLAVGLLGVALAAVEALPFLDALRASAILADRTQAAAPGGSIAALLLDWRAWPTLLTGLMPHLFGSARDGSYWYPAGNPTENTLYAGVLPLALALTALWAAYRRQLPAAARGWVLRWAALGVGFLAWALHLPLVNLINLLPPFQLLAAGRLRIAFVLAVAILAGFGLDHLRAQPRAARKPLAVVLGLMAAANLLLAAGGYAGFILFKERLIASGRAFMQANVGRPNFAQPLPELYAQVEAAHQAKVALFLPTNPVMFLPLLVAVVTLLLLASTRRRATLGVAVVAALLALTAVDLVWAGFDHNRAAPSAWLDPVPPAVTFLQQQAPPFRVAGVNRVLKPNSAMRYGLEDARGYEPLITQRYRALLAGIDGFAPEHHHLYLSGLDDPRLDRLNVLYGATATPPHDPRWEASFVDPSGVTVYRSRSALPRAAVLYAAEVVESPAASLARTLALDFDPRESVVLEETPADWSPPATLPSVPPQVVELARRANEVSLRVESGAPGLLLLLDAYVPGWHATVDDQPTPIYVANHAFRAVVVPAGTATVHFTYAPNAWIIGGLISVVAWLTLLGAALWLRTTRPRPAQVRP